MCLRLVIRASSAVPGQSPTSTERRASRATRRPTRFGTAPTARLVCDVMRATSPTCSGRVATPALGSTHPTVGSVWTVPLVANPRQPRRPQTAQHATCRMGQASCLRLARPAGPVLLASNQTATVVAASIVPLGSTATGVSVRRVVRDHSPRMIRALAIYVLLSGRISIVLTVSPASLARLAWSHSRIAQDVNRVLLTAMRMCRRLVIRVLAVIQGVSRMGS